MYNPIISALLKIKVFLMSSMQGKSYVIGVCGASCSGKTTVCEEIVKIVTSIFKSSANAICVISQDNYYKGGNADTNYDVVEAVDFELLTNHVEKLVDGKIVEVPMYDFATHSRKKETQVTGPSKIIIVEGILIFANENIRKLCNLKIFVEADPVVCYTRRLKRDVQERGRTFEEVEQRYIRDVIPSFLNYIEPVRFHVDVSLINNSTNKNFIG